MTYTLSIDIDDPLVAGIYQLGFDFTAEVYDSATYPLVAAQLRSASYTFSFQVTLKCNPESPEYPLTRSQAKCLDYDFCADNYIENADGSLCNDYNNCLVGIGEATGGKDVFNNTCNPEFYSGQCSRGGWPYDRENAPCPTFDFTENNFEIDVTTGLNNENYDPCDTKGDGGKVFDLNNEFCPKQYFGVCQDQEVAIPFGWYAD